MLRFFKGDVSKAIVAYNRGRGGVSRNGIDKLGQAYLDGVAKNMTKEKRKELGLKVSYD